jgi:hypothetical protein
MLPLTCLTELESLDLFGARITHAGARYIGQLPNLTSLEACGGGMTDDAVAALRLLTRMLSLNLAQNDSLSDHCVTYLLEMSRLTSLSLAGARPAAARVPPARSSNFLTECCCQGTDTRVVSSSLMRHIILSLSLTWCSSRG